MSQKVVALLPAFILAVARWSFTAFTAILNINVTNEELNEQIQQNHQRHSNHIERADVNMRDIVALGATSTAQSTIPRQFRVEHTHMQENENYEKKTTDDNLIISELWTFTYFICRQSMIIRIVLVYYSYPTHTNPDVAFKLLLCRICCCRRCSVV